MNVERMKRQMEEIEAVKEMLALAGVDPQTALVALEAISDKQRDYGADVRFSALANLWNGAPQDYKTPEFASTIIRAANRHNSAKWWIEQEHKFSMDQSGSFYELDSDIEEEVSIPHG